MPPEVVIVSACRTPIGKAKKSLASFRAPALGSIVLREAVARAHLKPGDVDEVIMGNVITAGLGQNPARQAAIGAGIPVEVPAFTVNKVCGSSLKAVMLAAQAIRAGDAKTILAGGQESMTNAPFLDPTTRAGLRIGKGERIDSMGHDGLWDHFNDYHMGATGEIVAQRYKVSREDADRLSLRSHERALAATREGKFAKEIVPVPAPQADGSTRMLTEDEGIRPDTSLAALAKLAASFQPGGLVTAGNSSQISDGASATVIMDAREAQRRGLKPLGRIIAYDSSAVKPEWVMEAPIPSVRNLLKKTGHTIDDVDLFEHNEAFASASCAVRAQLRVPDDRFNVHGGAVALGHPIGASGARVLTTLLYALDTYGKSRGVATLCLGGGGGVSMMVERA